MPTWRNNPDEEESLNNRLRQRNDYKEVQRRIQELRIEKKQFQTVENTSRNHLIKYLTAETADEYSILKTSHEYSAYNDNYTQQNEKVRRRKRLYQIMQDNYNKREERQKDRLEKQILNLKNQKKRVDELQIDRHQKAYDQYKIDQRLKQGLQNSDLGQLMNINLSKHESPSQYVNNSSVKSIESMAEKQKLISKQSQYAKYVNEVFRPKIKAKSQERILSNLQINRKVQRLQQNEYSNLIHHQQDYLPDISRPLIARTQLSKPRQQQNIDDDPNQYVPLKYILKQQQPSSLIKLKSTQKLNPIEFLKRTPVTHKKVITTNGSESSFDSECSECQRARRDSRLSHHKKGQKHHAKMPINYYVPQSKLKMQVNNPYDWREYVGAEREDSASQREKIIKEKAKQWEERARQKEKEIRRARREEKVDEIKEINGHLVGALKAKLSIIDSFEF